MSQVPRHVIDRDFVAARCCAVSSVQSTVNRCLSKGRLGKFFRIRDGPKAVCNHKPTEASTNRPGKGEIDVHSANPLSGRLQKTRTTQCGVPCRKGDSGGSFSLFRHTSLGRGKRHIRLGGHTGPEQRLHRHDPENSTRLPFGCAFSQALIASRGGRSARRSITGR